MVRHFFFFFLSCGTLSQVTKEETAFFSFGKHFSVSATWLSLGGSGDSDLLIPL